MLLNPDSSGAEADVLARLAGVRASLARATADAQRTVGSVSLVCVSKTIEPPAIAAAIDAGERIFGENRVQEASRKWPALRARGVAVELHLIGPLQTNKVREAMALFDCIETLDRPRLAEALAAERARAQAGPRCSFRSTPGRSRRRLACCRARSMRFSTIAANG